MSAFIHSAVLLTCLAATLGCQDESRPPQDPRPQFTNTGTEPDQAPRLEGVTHILVSFPPPDARLGPPWSITEPDAIHHLVMFLQRHSSRWHSAREHGSARFAGPMVYADVFRGTSRLATLTYRGPVELGIEAKYASLYQTAVDTLVTLLRIPIRIVPVPPRDTESAPAPSRRTATAPPNYPSRLSGANVKVVIAARRLEVQRQSALSRAFKKTVCS